MNIWTIIETDEDGFVSPWREGHTTEEAAFKAIVAYHEELWADAKMPEGEGALQSLPTSYYLSLVCLVEERSWPTWTVVKNDII